MIYLSLSILISVFNPNFGKHTASANPALLAILFFIFQSKRLNVYTLKSKKGYA